MKKLFLSFYFFGISVISVCQANKESEFFYQRAMSEINPKYVKWIKTKAAEADVSPQGIKGLQKSAWEDFVESEQKTSGAIDPNALVQCVLRESYMQTTKDLRFYAEKVKYFNECKKLVRDYLQKLRDYDSKMRETSRSQFDSIKKFSHSLELDMTPPSNPNLNRTIIRKDTLKTQTINWATNPTPVKPVTPEEVELLIKELLLKDKLLEQNSQQASSKVQVLMDKAQKADSISTDLYKKFAASANSIIANLK